MDPSGARPTLVRRAGPPDLETLREIVHECVPAPLREAVFEPLACATSTDSAEERCLVGGDREGGAITGFALFGLVAGTRHTGRVRAVAVTPLARRRGVGRALLGGALQQLDSTGARLVVAEVPDEPEMVYFVALLAACGFAEESTVPDLIRDGVAMRYLVRRS